MALTSLPIPCCLALSTKVFLKAYNGLHQSHDLLRRINGTSTISEPKRSHFMGISSQTKRCIIPKSLKCYSFDPDSGDIMENDMNEAESSRESNEEVEIKRTSWVESLVELRKKWWNIWQQKEVPSEEKNPDEVEDGEEDGEMGYKLYGADLFSRFLAKVPWSDTKLFSKLAFLSNMAYMIPEIKAMNLKRHYGLQFVTSSLEKQADAVMDIEAKLDQHSTKINASRTASTMTKLMAAASGKETQEAANDIKLPHFLPCEWFSCDDPTTCTRFFVIQGIDSLASWHAYLLFEPIEFEGTGALVHRGIYEVAKKLYEQFEPRIVEHLVRHGEQAKLQFTGHSLGGSLSVLVHLMLLTRKLVKPSTLMPVITFGSPYVFCGSQKVFELLGIDECDHIHCVIMHRDIVPRSFTSTYPNHVVTILKALHGSFDESSHPCLTKNKRLYSPMGRVFILQPDENSSPPHPLLPLGCALYALDNTQCGSSSSVLKAFLNSPHPLETLSDPTAYGSEGTILRDHDSCNYLKAMNC